MNRISIWWRKEKRRYRTAWRLIPKTTVLLHGVAVLAALFIAGTALAPDHPACAGATFMILFLALAVLTYLGSEKGYTIDGRN
jgi:hypothetical protein